MFPRSLIGRSLAIVWLLLCVGILAFGYAQRAVHDMPIAFLGLTLYITLPVGTLAASAWPFIFFNASAPDQAFAPYFWAWLFSVTAAYTQWFVLLPWLWRKLPSDRVRFRSLTLLAVGVSAAAWGCEELRQGHYAWFFGRIAICCIITLGLLLWAAKEPGNVEP